MTMKQLFWILFHIALTLLTGGFWIIVLFIWYFVVKK